MKTNRTKHIGKVKEVFHSTREIKKNARIYSLGQYLSKGINILVFPLVAVELGLAKTGKYDLVITTVTILTAVLTLQIGEAFYRWLTDADIQKRKVGFSNGLVIMAGTVITILLGYALMSQFYSLEFLFTGFLLLLTQSIFMTFSQIERGLGKVTTHALANVIKTAVFAVFALMAVFLTENMLHNVLWAMLIGNVFGILVCAREVIGSEYWDKGLVSLKHIKELLGFTIPLLLNRFSWIFLVNVNKYIIAGNLEASQNGIFAVTERLASPIYLLALFYYLSAQDLFQTSAKYRENRKQFMQLILKVTLITIAGILALQLGAVLFLPWLFPELTDVIEYIPFMAFANLLIALAVYFGIPYIYEKKTLSMAFVTVFGVVVMIAISFLSVEQFGLYGIYSGIIIGSAVIVVICIIHTRGFHRQLKASADA